MAHPSIPLNTLRAFEAAARHQSVKRASEELNVTASAVSHHVRQLEAILGAALFTRDGRGLTLTEAGARLRPKLTEGFALIASSLDDHQTHRAMGPLRLSVLEIFAHWWLLPRLSSYPLARRGYALEIESSQRVVSFETEDFDAAVRIGGGQWPGVISDHLFDERLGVYASAKGQGQDAPVFVSKPRQDEWKDWCASASPPIAAASAVILVDSASTALKAALDGAGYCFAGDLFTARDVAAGRLRPLDQAATTSARGSYWLVYPQRSRRDPRLQNFRRWLLDQAARPPARTDDLSETP